MARMTASQRKAQAEAQRKAQLQELTDGWHTRVHEAMLRATGYGMEIGVTRSADHFNYKVTFVDAWNDTETLFLATMLTENDQASLYNLVLLERELDRLQAKYEEEARVAKVRSEALAKLTDEERKLLGV